MIISAALLQRERGVPGTAIPDVLAHSGAPRGSVYYHFPQGRAQLAEEATQHAADQLSEMLDQLLAERSVFKVIDALADFWRGLLEGEHYAAGCPIAAGALDFTEESGARRVAAEGFERWCAAIAERLEGSGLSAPQARQLSLLAICSFEGALIVGRAGRTTEPVDAVADQLKALIGRDLPGR